MIAPGGSWMALRKGFAPSGVFGAVGISCFITLSARAAEFNAVEHIEYSDFQLALVGFVLP